MILDLSKLLVESGAGNRKSSNYSGSTKEYTVNVETDTFECDGASYQVLETEPIVLKVSVTSRNKVTITGDTSITLKMPCDRCLEPTRQVIDIDIESEVDFDEPDDECQVYVSEQTIDVDKLLCSYIITNLPMKVLCSDDCKGLCGVCGANLNNGECGCDRFVPDPRMAAIGDIFKNFSK